jgi:putative transposase
VEINGQRYNGAGLNLFRNVRSPYPGAHAGKWPIMVDAHDVRFVYFQNPDTTTWHRLEWEHAAGLMAPFSQDAADYAKKVSVRLNRHVDPQQAVHQLLEQWSRGEVLSRRDRALARRVSAERAHEQTAAASISEQRDAAAAAGSVVDLLARREAHAGQPALEVVDDLDVFAQYYHQFPDGDGLQVLD